MKILHILDHSLPLHSGYSFRSQNIFREQRKRGWDPVIVTSPKHEESWKGHWKEKENIGRLQYYRTGRVPRSSFPLEAEARLIASLGRKILDVAKIEKPDLIHAHSPVLNAIPALWAGRKLDVPVVYEIRAFWEDAAVDHGTYREGSWKYKFVRSIETWVCRKSDQVVVLCHGLKDDLIKRGIPAEKITVVFNGINPEDFKPCAPDREFQKKWNLEGKRVIGFIGSFYRYEGIDLLIRAFSSISGEYPDAVLLLVGDGEMEPELNKLNKLHNRIVMPGRISHDRIPGVYALIDMFVYPRYSMRLTELVTPLKPLEAMAMGKALLASDVGGHHEIIRHNETGILFPASNASALAKSLERILDDDLLRKKIQEKGAAWVRQTHTWEKTTSVYEDIYAKALGS